MQQVRPHMDTAKGIKAHCLSKPKMSLALVGWMTMESNSEYMRNYRKTHPEYVKKQKEYSKIYNKEHSKDKQKYVKMIKLKVKQILGTKCKNCGTEKNLHLHHKYYAKDSVKPRQHGFNRYYEAYKHPERFKILCALCHIQEHHPILSMNPSAISQRKHRAKLRQVNGSA